MSALPTQMIGGLVSGMDTNSIIDQLMTIERRPLNNLETKKAEAELQLEAYRGVNNLLMEYTTHVGKVASDDAWKTRIASSPDESVIQVSANEYADTGTYSFRVGRLAQTAQFMTGGFSDRATAISPYAAGSINIDRAGGSVVRSTSLSQLNGGQGIYHGKIRITDSIGRSSLVDLSTAESMDDVISAINGVEGLNVEASIDPTGHRLRVQDFAGGGGNMLIEDVGLGQTALDLGIAGVGVAAMEGGQPVSRIDGAEIDNVTAATPLTMLNDGLGVNDGTPGSISIVLDDGTPENLEIDLSSATTLNDVAQAINAAHADLSATLTSRGLEITSTKAGASLTITNTNETDTTAADLGIVGTAAWDGAKAAVTGVDLVGGMNTVRIGSLSGQRHFDRDALLSSYAGVAVGETITITDKEGNAVDFAVAADSTMGDFVDAVNDASDAAKLVAYMDRSRGGLVIGSTASVVTGTLSITSSDGDATAAALGFGAGNNTAGDGITGIRGDRIHSDGINGTRTDAAGDLGQIRLSDGVTDYVFDFTGAAGGEKLDGGSSFHRLVEVLNNEAARHGIDGEVSFRINRAKNGVEMVNASGANSYTVTDETGTTATDLGLADQTVAAGSTLNAGDLDARYLSRATKLTSLNGGKGVFAGSISITGSRGFQATVDLTGSKTVGDVLEKITSSNAGVIATVNDTGDGILLTDTLGGPGSIQVEELGGGTTARDLGIFGEGLHEVDGSFEANIEIDQDDTLTDVMNKITQQAPYVSASIINDGSAAAPYRLVIASETSGRAGDLLVDSNLPAMNFTQTARGLDSVLLYGQDGGGSSPLLVTSSSNQHNSAVLGLSIDLKRVNSEYLSVTVGNDEETPVQNMMAMVESYNTLVDLVGELDTYDQEKAEGGILYADRDVRELMNTLSDSWFNLADSPVGGIQSWFDLGVSFDDKGKLTFDSVEFNNKLESDFEAVRDLLTQSVDVARADLNAFANGNGRPDYVAPNVLDTLADGSTEGPPSANAGDRYRLSKNSGPLHAGWGSLAGTSQSNDIIVEYDGADWVIDEAATRFDSRNLINGNTNSADFGDGNGMRMAKTVAEGDDTFNLSFDKPRWLTRLSLHHFEDAADPDTNYALKDFQVELLNAATGNWETVRNISGNRQPFSYIGLSGPTLVSDMRIKVDSVNAPDGKARLVEVEAFESSGLASEMDRITSARTDSRSGFFATQEEEITNTIRELDNEIEKMESRLEDIEVNYIREYAAMESALSQLTAQGDYFSQQMSALNGNDK